MSTSALKRYTVEEYLAFERESDTKHEYYDGEIFAMTGASLAHNLITGNLVAALNVSLRDTDCLVLPQDMRVHCPTGLYTYPDVTVVCGSPERLDERTDTLLNPLILFEVASPSTEAYDRGRKFGHYRTIVSLKEYVLVAQNRPTVDHFARQTGTDQWLMTSYSNLEQNIELPAIDGVLAMSDLFAKVEFPPEEPNGTGTP